MNLLRSTPLSLKIRNRRKRHQRSKQKRRSSPRKRSSQRKRNSPRRKSNPKRKSNPRKRSRPRKRRLQKRRSTSITITTTSTTNTASTIITIMTMMTRRVTRRTRSQRIRRASFSSRTGTSMRTRRFWRASSSLRTNSARKWELPRFFQKSILSPLSSMTSRRCKPVKKWNWWRRTKTSSRRPTVLWALAKSMMRHADRSRRRPRTTHQRMRPRSNLRIGITMKIKRYWTPLSMRRTSLDRKWKLPRFFQKSIHTPRSSTISRRAWVRRTSRQLIRRLPRWRRIRAMMLETVTLMMRNASKNRLLESRSPSPVSRFKLLQRLESIRIRKRRTQRSPSNFHTMTRKRTKRRMKRKSPRKRMKKRRRKSTRRR